jgi:indole-3-glycerol phosphate synthase
MSEQESVLARILDHKRVEVDRQQDEVSIEALKARCASAPPVRSFAAALRRPDTVALIAEVKKASPSKGVFLENFDHLAIARTYAESGAAALSVLTDIGFFQGNLTYLAAIRELPEIEQIPLLRKDFIVDPYQVYEARAYGADALLLIVAALDDATLRSLLQLTNELGMQALVEVHDEAETERALQAGATILGVNNRDLRSFVTSLDVTERVAKLLPSGAERPIFVSESGIFSAADVARVRASGVDAVLVGESLITAPDIGAKVREIAGVSR